MSGAGTPILPRLHLLDAQHPPQISPVSPRVITVLHALRNECASLSHWESPGCSGAAQPFFPSAVCPSTVAASVSLSVGSTRVVNV